MQDTTSMASARRSGQRGLRVVLAGREPGMSLGWGHCYLGAEGRDAPHSNATQNVAVKAELQESPSWARGQGA